jgi:hypothetical protein
MSFPLPLQLLTLFGLLLQHLAYPLFFQNLDLSELLAFDPATIGSTILEAADSSSGLTSTIDRLLRVKELLLGPISALIQDSSAVK